MRDVIRHLRRAALLHKGDGPSDGQLLESFVARREETAFEALLRRHGPMVLGVCQRVLRNIHDAEDAFQATFLVLTRKASLVMPREMVGNWLYGVAYRTAMKARAMSIKRRTKERQVAEMSRPPNKDCEELLSQLDHALTCLPDKYRVPIVLCELEGRSRKEVAGLLGIPEGTLSWRLAQAKKMLAKRLSRRELAIPLGALAVGMSPTLRASTIETALTAGAVPAKVLALTEGVMKAMLLTKLKITVCVAAMALVAGIGATGVAYRAVAQEPRRSALEVLSTRAEQGRPAADDLESLRLEIEALRKSLQATRERVKALEGEVTVLKDKSANSAGKMGGGGGSGMMLGGMRPPGQGGPMGAGGHGMMGGSGGGMRGGPMGGGLPGGGGLMRPGATQSGSGAMRGSGPLIPKAKSDPVSAAEAALKKLRENPGDEQAVEALERALQKLKERDKPKTRGEGGGANPSGSMPDRGARPSDPKPEREGEGETAGLLRTR